MAEKDAILSCVDRVLNCFNNGSEDTEELFQSFKEILPIPDSSYKIISVKGDVGKFKGSIKCNLNSVEDIECFVQNYEKQGNEKLRKLSPSFPGSKSAYSFIQYYRCHHKTYHQPSKLDLQKQ